MCGICGIIDNKRTPDQGKVRAMNQALYHRGPNSEGSFAADGVQASMRRLSIIDLDGGSQPLWNEDKTISLVANGEIYNFVELRKELIDAGHRFSTASDCETIIQAYEEYGDAFIHKLRGMFAFCLHDSKRRKTLIARDRLGEKPLYIYEDPKGGSLAFSSELKSLLELIPKKDRQIDADSLNLFFHYGYTPEPRSIIRGVRKLAPATLLAFDHATNTAQETVYWDMTAAENRTSDNPARDIRAELDAIERIIIRSDVPVGVSLSGGIDSSSIALLAAQHSTKPLHAFSVSYPDYPATDESAHAEKLARDLGMKFSKVPLTEQDFLNDFDAVTASMDDPVNDIAAYGYFAVSRAARAANVPVLLAGFGGDELLWGYEWVRTAARYAFMKQNVLGRVRLACILLKRFWKEIAKHPTRAAEWLAHAFSNRILLYELTPFWRYARVNRSKIFTSEFLASIDANLPTDIERRTATAQSGVSITELISKHWLIGNCIDLGDRMSMAHSIELRLPLVDYKLFELAIGLRKERPMDYREGHKKWLVDAMKDLLPADIAERKKAGFTPPSTRWTRSLVSQRSQMLVNGYLVRNNIVRKEHMERCLRQIDKNLKFLYTALVFESWAKRYLPYESLRDSDTPSHL